MARKMSNKRDIVQEFANYFGNESKLANWQMLCNDLHIGRDLSSIRKCKAVRDSPANNNSTTWFIRNTTLLTIQLIRLSIASTWTFMTWSMPKRAALELEHFQIVNNLPHIPSRTIRYTQKGRLKREVQWSYYWEKSFRYCVEEW